MKAPYSIEHNGYQLDAECLLRHATVVGHSVMVDDPPLEVVSVSHGVNPGVLFRSPINGEELWLRAPFSTALVARKLLLQALGPVAKPAVRRRKVTDADIRITLSEQDAIFLTHCGIVANLEIQ